MAILVGAKKFQPEKKYIEVVAFILKNSLNPTCLPLHKTLIYVETLIKIGT